MKVLNIHKRALNAPAEKVGELIDGLASANDLLWPIDRWPAMQFDRPLGIGASGGHGPIRHVVESYVPGRSIQFRFIEPKGFVGIHRFEIEPTDDRRATLRHVVKCKRQDSRGWHGRRPFNRCTTRFWRMRWTVPKSSPASSCRSESGRPG